MSLKFSEISSTAGDSSTAAMRGTEAQPEPKKACEGQWLRPPYPMSLDSPPGLSRYLRPPHHPAEAEVEGMAAASGACQHNLSLPLSLCATSLGLEWVC